MILIKIIDLLDPTVPRTMKQYKAYYKRSMEATKFMIYHPSWEKNHTARMLFNDLKNARLVWQMEESFQSYFEFRRLESIVIYLQYPSLLDTSVADPWSYWYVFGPPRSRSISTRYGYRSFYHQANIVRQTLIPNVLWVLHDFLIFEKWCKCSLKK